MAFTLINARPSPYGRKVAVALVEKGLDYTVRYDVPWGEDTCTPQFSPLQQLPILITDSDECIYDSTYILEWLETRFPQPALLPLDVDQRLHAKLRQMLGERLMEVAQSLVFELHRPSPSAPWVDRQTRKLAGGVDMLERLVAGRAPGPHDGIDLGDIAVGTTLQIFDFIVPAGLSPPTEALSWREGHPQLVRLIDGLAMRPSFAKTVPERMDVNLEATIK